MSLNSIFPTEIYVEKLEGFNHANNDIFNYMLSTASDIGNSSSPLELNSENVSALLKTIERKVSEAFSKELKITQNWGTLYQPNILSNIPMHSDLQC